LEFGWPVRSVKIRIQTYECLHWQEDTMHRERALQVVLVVVGLLFTAGIIPLVMFFSREPAVGMLMSIYVTMGICLLLAARNPAANGSLIIFAGWANVAHAGVMAVQEFKHVIQRQELLGVVLFGAIGVLLVAIAPQKVTERVSAASV
jgi:tryptophan-rich sensory protein